MSVRIGINGFGRIGRLVFRASIGNPKADVLAINDPFLDPKLLAYLLKYDSVHGRFKGTIELKGNDLIVDGKIVKIVHELQPEKINWGSLGVDYVAECTGTFTKTDSCLKHIAAGAKKAIISAPPSDNTPIFVVGVNHKEYKKEMKVVSNASCTTNCLAPIAKVVNDNFEIEEGIMTTIHAVTINQLTIDGLSIGGKDWRAGRCAINNIIPASTGAAKAVGRVIPELNGKITGMAFRVPTANVSVIDFTVRTKKSAPYEEVVNKLKEAAQGSMKGILAVKSDEVVSQDFVGDSHSSIFDVKAGIALNSNFLKLIS